MPVRSGSYTNSGLGGLTLDPYGGNSGGLGRYSFGDTMASIDAAERYAVSVGWQNGTVTDEDYLKSLHRAIELAPPGSRELTSAKDAYDDAVYTIGRNKIVRRINNAATDDARITEYRALIAYDQDKLRGMVGDNEQTRELRDRINGSQADIRATRWAQRTRSYNENRASNQSMLDFAKQAAREAQGAPDQQTWEDRVFEFSERMKDEHLEEIKQDYDMDRVGGGTVLAFVDRRLGEMSKQSPRYGDLSRWREDFAKAFHADAAAEKYAEKYSDYQEGKLSDSQWLRYLNERINDAPRGSEERRSYQHDLVMETFRVAEGRLVYDIQVNNAPVKGLINFYQNSLKTMDNGSARAMDLRQKIQRLKIDGINSIDLGGPSADPDHTAPGHTVGGGHNTYPGGGTGSSSANRVIAAARAYLGTPYKLGAESRSQVDCSGLIFRAFTDSGMGDAIGGQRLRAEGYERQAQQDGRYFTNRSDLQRGDMVLYGNGAHIGIYIGNGKVLSALTTGVAKHRIDGIGERVTGFVRPNYPDAPPPANPKRGGTVGRGNNNNGNQSPGHTVPGGNTQGPLRGGARTYGGPGGLAPDADTGKEKPQRAKKGEPVTTTIYQRSGGAGTGTNPNEGGTTRTNGRPPTELPGAMTQMSKELLRQLGVRNPSDEQVRAVGTWLVAENGSTVANNNPFNLVTPPGVMLPGQIGVDGSGYAIFDTWQKGISAGATEIQRGYPTVVHAINKGDAEGILGAIEGSDWRPGGYGNTLAPTYNSTGPGRTVIAGGTRVFDTPQSWGALAARAPHVADLFEINWADASNKTWFNANLNELARAYNNYDPTGQRAPGTWNYTTQSGNIVNLPFAPELYTTLLNAKANYQDIANEDSSGTYEQVRSIRAKVTTEQFNAEIKSVNAAIQRATLAGDVTLAVQLSRQLLGLAAGLLDLDSTPPDVEINVANYKGSDFDASELADLQTKINAALPLTPDNPDGNPILGLLDPNSVNPAGVTPFIQTDNPKPSAMELELQGQAGVTVGRRGQVKVNPLAVYFTQDSSGNIHWRTWQTDPDQFLQEQVTDPKTGATHMVPAYMKSTVGVNVGAEVMIRADVKSSDIQVGILDTGRYREPNAQVGFTGNNWTSSTGGTGTANAGAAPAAPGGFDPLGGLADFLGGINRGLTGGAQSPLANYQPTPDRGANPLQGTVPGSVPAADNDDYLVRPSYANIPAMMVSYYDANTKKHYQAYSLDGGQTYIIAPTTQGAEGVKPVLNPEGMGKRVAGGYNVINGAFVMWDQQKNDWRPYVPADGPLSQFFHWFGTDERDTPTGQVAQGAQDHYYPIRHAGADGFDGSLTFMEDFVISRPTRKTVGETFAAAAVAYSKTPGMVAEDARETRIFAGRTAVEAEAHAAVAATVARIVAQQKTEAGVAADAREMASMAAFSTGYRLTGSTTASTTRAQAIIAKTRPITVPVTPTAAPVHVTPKAAPRPAPITTSPLETPKTQPRPTPSPVTPRKQPVVQGPSYTPPKPTPTPKKVTPAKVQQPTPRPSTPSWYGSKSIPKPKYAGENPNET